VILSCAVTEDIGLAQRILKGAIPIIRKYWPLSKRTSQTIKDEMLIMLIYAELFLPVLIKNDSEDECTSDLQGLLEVLQAEVVKRCEKEPLHIDDLDLTTRVDENHSTLFSTNAFQLRAGAVKLETAWTLLQVITIIFTSLHESAQRLASSESEVLEAPKKRQKVAGPIDNLLESLTLSPTADRLAGLQTLAFILCRWQFDGYSLQKVLDRAIPMGSSDNASLVTWSMLVLARYTISYNFSPWDY
jgi:hypothetical protein